MLRIVPLLMIWMMTSGVSLGQAKFESPPHWDADRRENFFPYSELKKLDERRIPVGWSDVSAFETGHAKALNRPHGVFQLKCPEDGSETSISVKIDLPIQMEFVTILTRMRGPTVVLGKSDDAGAGMIYSLIDDDGNSRVLPRVEPIYNYGSLGGWKTYRNTIAVLPQDVQLKISASIVDAKGAFEVDRIMVVNSKPGFQATPQQVQELMLAIRSDDALAIKELIKETPEMLESRNGIMENGTPLICAAWHNSSKVTKMLIELGADMEASDEAWQNTPLAWCCWWGNAETAEVLIDAGALTKHYERMAASSKKTNPRPRGKPEDFDRIIELIKAAKKAAKQ